MWGKKEKWITKLLYTSGTGRFMLTVPSWEMTWHTSAYSGCMSIIHIGTVAQVNLITKEAMVFSDTLNVFLYYFSYRLHFPSLHAVARCMDFSRLAGFINLSKQIWHCSGYLKFPIILYPLTKLLINVTFVRFLKIFSLSFMFVFRL